MSDADITPNGNAFEEIMALRKQGRLQQAYERAQQALQQSPEDLWVRRAMGWVLYDSLKRELQSVSEEDERDEGESARCNLKQVHKHFVEFYHLELPRDDTLIYSCMLRMAIKAQRAGWAGFVKFVQWWGVEHLTDEDRTAKQSQDGKTISSLEQKLLYALGRALKQAPSEQREWIIGVLEQAAPRYAQDIWIQRALAHAEAMRGNHQSAQERFRAILRQKPREWWMWREMAEFMEPIDAEQAILCYYHACHLSPDKSKLVGVYQRLAELLAAQGRYAEAAWCAQRAYHYRTRHQWRIPEELAQLLETPELLQYPNAPDPQVDTRRFAERLLAPVAPEAIQQTHAVVDHHNPTKEITYLLFSPRNGAPLPHKRFPHLKSLPVGTIVELEYYTDDQGRQRIIYCQPTQLSEIADFVRTVQGTLRKSSNQEFGFIHTPTGERYFVPPQVAKELPDNATVEALCVLKYNEKREREDWVAVRAHSLS
ncbi:MAG: hypothetical protein KatS3mg017_0588 [Fimbriimonadales bacterium]|nr:MAG: hypothetical protein KatS3mg017_0588 [Fimbriimonadales bacterium]